MKTRLLLQNRSVRLILLAFFSGSGMVLAQPGLPQVEQVKFPADTFRITQYGAVGNGITLNTAAIQAAIDACSKKGGGVVLVPNGLWLTGPLVLKSQVNLCISRGAVLQFTKDFDQYPLVESNYEGLPAWRCQSPVSARNAENIAITGAGVIDGGGDAWRMVKKEKLTESQWKKLVASGGVLGPDEKSWYPSAKSFKGAQTKNPGVIQPGRTMQDAEAIKDFLRPNMISLVQCKKILLEGVTFQNSPAWCIHPLLCEQLTVRNIYAKNPWYAQNGDGIDIESVRYALVENSTFDVGDDGICIKSGRDEEGRKRGVPTENVVIRNCVVYHAHGGFVIGSEMSGGVKNLYVFDCSFIGTDVGLRFKTTRGRGGVVEKIFVSNINMKDIAGEAILFDMYYAAKDPVPLAGEKRDAPRVEMLPVTEATPQFRDFDIQHVVCLGAEKGIFIRGLPEMHVSNIRLNNIAIRCNKGVDIQEATGVQLHNLQLSARSNQPLVYIENSSNITFDHLEVPGEKPGLLFSIQGSRNTGIRVSNTDTTVFREKAVFGNGAAENVLHIQ
jgi:polygalacturonase